MPMAEISTQIFLAWCEYRMWCEDNRAAIGKRAHQDFLSFRLQMLSDLELIHTWLTGDYHD
jgi:hypothetical protein